MSNTETIVIEATAIHEPVELFEVRLTREELTVIQKLREFNSAENAWNMRWINEPGTGDENGG